MIDEDVWEAFSMNKKMRHMAKTGDPREKPPDHQQAELGLPHM